MRTLLGASHAFLCRISPPLDVSRLRYVNKFVSDVVQVAAKLRPLPDRPVEEVRETFATKLELSMKLAISKYKPIQVVLKQTRCRFLTSMSLVSVRAGTPLALLPLGVLTGSGFLYRSLQISNVNYVGFSREIRFCGVFGTQIKGGTTHPVAALKCKRCIERVNANRPRIYRA